MGNRITVQVGQRVALYDNEGNIEIVEGPARISVYNRRATWLRKFTAEAEDYLVVRYLDGRKEHIRGPTVLYENPTVIESITSAKGTKLDASEVLVVYRQKKEGLVERTLVEGPTLHVPTTEEWVHEFSWHGSLPGNPDVKVRDARKFSKLRIIPDQFYYTVSEVRTNDDALLTVKLMIFFELKKIEQMLDSTHDPVADFINAVSADVIAFASTLSYELFL